MQYDGVAIYNDNNERMFDVTIDEHGIPQVIVKTGSGSRSYRSIMVDDAIAKIIDALNYISTTEL